MLVTAVYPRADALSSPNAHERAPHRGKSARGHDATPAVEGLVFAFASTVTKDPNGFC